MRLAFSRDLLWLAPLCWCGGAALLAAKSTFPDPLGTDAEDLPPMVEAADLAREYQADPAAAARRGYRTVRMRVRVDRVREDGPGARRGNHFWVDQHPAGGDPGVTARVPWNDRGRVRAGDRVVVCAIPRGYADGRLELGTAIPD